jgi:excisionase family DNA binding protein
MSQLRCYKENLSMPRIIDVVEAPDQGPNDLVARVPEIGSGDFRLGSQVIVRESQRAIFYRDGKSLDTFGPGRHTITTMNLPILSGLMQMFTGGNDVFTAEVYFVNMREFTDMKWGTPQPISLRDADLGVVRLRAFGQYTMQVADPKLFVDKIVGTQGAYTTAQVEEYLRAAILNRLTDVLGENMTSILDLPKLFDEISAGMKAKAQDDFAAVGINLRQFMLVSISPTDETAKAMDERAAMGAIGNLDAYMKFKAARAMGDAAQQPGGGSAEGLGLGAGIGLGSAMAGMVSQAMGATQQAGQQAPQPGATAAGSSVMTLEEAAAYLKVTPADVQAMIDSGDLKARKIGAQVRISKEAIDTFLAG